jgi:hypothetical protein
LLAGADARGVKESLGIVVGDHTYLNIPESRKIAELGPSTERGQVHILGNFG